METADRVSCHSSVSELDERSAALGIPNGSLAAANLNGQNVPESTENFVELRGEH